MPDTPTCDRGYDECRGFDNAEPFPDRETRRREAAEQFFRNLPPAPPIDVMEMDLSKVESPVLRRLIDEVRNGTADNPCPYSRFHNRHNRSGYGRFT